MRSIKLTLVGLFAAAAVVAGPQLAQNVASAGPVDPTAAGMVLMSDESDHWTGGAAKDLGANDWRATVSNGEVTMLLGHYATEKEALKAAKKEARKMNGFVDGPGCDAPEVLC